LHKLRVLGERNNKITAKLQSVDKLWRIP